jgi:hypothetical protein
LSLTQLSKPRTLEQISESYKFEFLLTIEFPFLLFFEELTLNVNVLHPINHIID